MDFIELEESEILGIDDIDEQHKKFAKLASELYELLGQDKPETVKYLLNQIVSEIKTHFSTEEKYMKDNKYLNYFSHKQEHDRFYSKLLNLKDEIEAGKTKVNLEILKSFKNWLKNHIELNDKKLAVYLLENEIKLNV